MIEQGLVMLIQAGIATAWPTVPGGFAGTLPENQAPPAYTYRVISDRANLTLLSFSGFGQARFEFNCFGVKASDALLLANAVDKVLNGYTGTLSDPDSTMVDSIFRQDREGPDYSDSARNFYVMLEYLVSYYSS